MAIRNRESDIVRACLEYLTLKGIWAMRCNAGTVYVNGRRITLAPEGTPDILGYLPGGRMLAIECKRKGGVVRPAQKAWIDRAAGQGVLAVIIDDVKDLEAIVEAHLG